ncbi:hypothetical protein JNUCC23_08975 [Peribacillus sp. JNUCC 23]
MGKYTDNQMKVFVQAGLD